MEFAVIVLGLAMVMAAAILGFALNRARPPAEPLQHDPRLNAVISGQGAIQGRFQESLPQYEETIRLNPRLAEARLGYGMALAGLRRFDAARQAFGEGAKIFPDRREFGEALNSLSTAGSSR